MADRMHFVPCSVYRGKRNGVQGECFVFVPIHEKQDFSFVVSRDTGAILEILEKSEFQTIGDWQLLDRRIPISADLACLISRWIALYREQSLLKREISTLVSSEACFDEFLRLF